MADKNPNSTNKTNVTKDGDGYKATVTRHFDTQEEATMWADGNDSNDTPEKAASDMSVEYAEEINSNVNIPVAPAGGTNVISGAGQEEAGAENGGQLNAPHLTPNPNGMSGPHDPNKNHDDDAKTKK